VLNVWAVEPPDGSTNPLLSNLVEAHWPATGNPALLRARRAGVQLVRKQLAKAPASPMLPGLTVLPDALAANERDQLRQWDADIDVLLGEAHQRSHAVDHLPQVMSASGVVQVLRNPKAATERRQRPLPVSPAPAAYRGTRFHEWVEARFGQVPLIDIDGVLPETPLDAELASMQQAFLAGPYADRRPVAVEAPFQMVLAGQLVSGRIDAVYEADSPSEHQVYEVVDWKTGHHEADELQLALYRLAWAELNGLDVAAVAATFYYVATGEVARPKGLPDREALTERWLANTYAQQP
jgi:DNA helicase-2/ATP-dependent DNA helicase PcrA